MENKILEILKNSDKAFEIHELNDLLGLKTLDEFKELIKVVNKLEEEYKVYRTKKDRFMDFNHSNLRVGKLIANKKGFGFVDIEGDEDVFVAPGNMAGAIHGDTVVVDVLDLKKVDKLEGKIVKVFFEKRQLDNMIGEVYSKDGINYIDLDDDKVRLTIVIDKEKTMGAVEGHKVIVKVIKKIGDNRYLGEVTRVLGHKNDPGVDILSIVKKYNIRDEFPEAVLEEANNLPNEVRLEDMVGRTDLRGEEIFTIDGDDTKDIDDAVSVSVLPNGNYKLGVHIADVSYYVKEGSHLDKEAFLRGTSNYLADRVIPMYPHVLSNGICSLNPNVDRLAETCEMEIDQKGNVVDYKIYPSIIHSRIQMTYNKVNRIFTDNNDIPEGYSDHKDTLLTLLKVSHILRENKVARGMLDFDIDESKIIVDETGKAVDVKLRTRGEGERLIEDLMIVANETMATHFFHLDYPFLYRVHGEPKKEKIENFIKFVSLLGYKLLGKVHDVHPKTMQGILTDLREKPEFSILSRLLLRSMQKAIYDKTNIGHYGLASKIYCHFTSPIRRYPDTIVHRLTRDFVFENNIDLSNFNRWNSKLVTIGEQSSQKERDAIECEREVDDMKKAEYMSDHIGEEFEGTISTVLSFGFFVELPNLIEGLVRVEELNNTTKDKYEFNEAIFAINSPHNPRGYRLGDTVKIKVISANKEEKKIDFSVVDIVKANDHLSKVE